MLYSKRLSFVAPAIIAVLVALLAVPVAFAHDSLVVSGNAQVNAGVSGSDDDSDDADEVEIRGNLNATGTVKVKDDDRDDEASSTDSDEDEDSGKGEEHRSSVAAEVQALLRVADRVGGIGADVRLIAREHASSSESIEDAEDKVEGRPAWLIFLIGTDYGNLGKLRSEIVTTQNHIKRLSDARDRTVDVTAQAELQAQIDALKAQASTTAEFVADNEDQFSLFGWLVKVFQ